MIKIGEELNDYILIGMANSKLMWLFRWKGKRDDYAMAVQKCIDNYEKALKQNWKNIYTPLKLIDCENCLGIEFNLGDLYSKQTELQTLFKDETVQKLRISISYFEKANAYGSVGSQYLRVANFLARYNDMRTAVIEAKKALPYYIKENDSNGEFDVYDALCGLYYELGDLENGLLYSKKAVRLGESLAKAKGNFDDSQICRCLRTHRVHDPTCGGAVCMRDTNGTARRAGVYHANLDRRRARQMQIQPARYSLSNIKRHRTACARGDSSCE